MSGSTVAGPARAHALERVLAALDAGSCRTLADIARAAGLHPPDVSTALTTLESIGRIRRVPLLGPDCSPEGCAGCGTRVGCPLVSSIAATTLQTWQIVPR